MTFLLFTCTETAIEPEKPGNGSLRGKDGNLNFVIEYASFGTGGDDLSTRSAADLEPETVVVPLEDGLSMYATLEPVNETVTTRSVALRSFVTGSQLYIVACDSIAPATYNYYHHVRYRVEANGLSSSLERAVSATPFDYLAIRLSI